MGINFIDRGLKYARSGNYRKTLPDERRNFPLLNLQGAVDIEIIFRGMLLRVVFSPEVRIGGGIDQLNIDPYPIAYALYSALEQGRFAQLLADLTHDFVVSR